MVEINNIQFEDLTFGYEVNCPLFQNLNLEFPDKKQIWVKAPPTSGKSTILKILAGLIMPQSGRYLLNGQDVGEMSFREFLPYRLNIGYSFDMGGLLANRTLHDNLMLPLLFHQRCSVEEADARVQKWMKRFEIAKVQHLRPFAVSGSQRKSLVVLRAFLHYPQIVLLDEPMAGLKDDGKQAFSDFVEECFQQHGLKRIIFCAERELPIKKFDPVILNVPFKPVLQEAA